MKLIPAIDLIEGKCVRLSKGDYATKKIYNEDPLEVAKEYEDHGITHLHVVDLDGAKHRQIINWRVLERLACGTSLHIDFGGGMQTDADVQTAFRCGARQVTGGSIAAKQPAVFMGWLKEYGADRIILGADCRNRKIATHGWLETSELDVVEFIANYERQGVHTVICTDIAKDGMLGGTSNDLYRDILASSNVELIASGGVSSLADLDAVREVGCAGVIIGKAIYENRITLAQLRDYA